MAYERPDQWTHGDIPTAAAMNHYTNSLIYLQPFFVIRNFFAKKSFSGNGVTFTLQKKFRWLHYIVATDKNNGELEDPAGVQDTIVLDKGEGSWNVLDLNTITWLTPGKVYWVKDAKIAIESRDQPTASTIE